MHVKRPQRLFMLVWEFGVQGCFRYIKKESQGYSTKSYGSLFEMILIMMYVYTLNFKKKVKNVTLKKKMRKLPVE